MQLVILAAGHARRFGALKQLAPVGPNDETIMDYTAMHAAECGFDGVVLVVREEIRDAIEQHVRKCWPASLGIDLVVQCGIAGTAQAVLSAAPVIEGPFGVANADDLYGQSALAALIAHFLPKTRPATTADKHLLIGYHLANTVLSPGELTRGLVALDDDHGLAAIVENRVVDDEAGAYRALPLSMIGTETDTEPARSRLYGDELVSMNLWGFHERMLDHLERAVRSFDPNSAPRPELLLPDVVESLVSAGKDAFHVAETEATCIGITHAGDLELVRASLLRAPEDATTSGP